jgi:hypothetical protein
MREHVEGCCSNETLQPTLVFAFLFFLDRWPSAPELFS